jgi:hypothetical protein
MYNLNEWHSVVRDTTAPTLTVDSGLRPKLFFGTELFIYNMTAMDDGQDISSNLQVITEGMLKSHVEGTATHTFSVLDSGGNEATLTTEVDVLGTWSQQTPVVHDFLTTTELPSNLTPDNDTTYEFNENGLQFTGDRPPSPYWNLIHQMNANGAAQFTLKGDGAGMTFRYANVDNHCWAVFLGGTIEIRERVNGDWTSRGSVPIENYSAETEYVFGLEVEDDIASIYLDGQPLGSVKVYDNLYNTGWGLWANSGSITFSKAMFAKPGDISFGAYDLPYLKPTALATIDGDAIESGAEFQLNGEGIANQPGTTIESYKWSQISLGTVIPISDPNAEKPFGTAPISTTSQEVTFELTVTDSNGETATATVEFTLLASSSYLLSLLAEVSKQRFTLQGSNILNCFQGRSNLEKVQFKPSSPNTAIALDNEGCYDFDENETQAVEVITPSGLISSANGDVEWEGSELYIRTGAFSSIKKHESARVVVYLANDTRGVVFAGPGLTANLIIHFN